MKRKSSTELGTPNKKKKYNTNEDNYFASLGRVHFKFAKYEEAISALSEAIDLDPNNAGYFSSLGASLSKLQRYEEAIFPYKEATRLDSENAEYCNNLGYIYFKLQRYEEAIVPYKEATRLDSKNAEYWGDLGYAHFKLGQYSEAIVPYEEATKLDSKNAEYLANLGYANFKLENYQESANAYIKLTDIDPTSTKYWSDLGYVYLKLGKNKEAVFVYTKLTKLEPTNVEYWVNLGVAYFKSREYGEAIVAYTKLTELEPTNVEHWTNLGYANFKLGKYQQAVDLYEKAREFDPQYVLNKISITIIQSTDSIEKVKEVIIKFIMPLNKNILNFSKEELLIQTAKTNIADSIVKYTTISTIGKNAFLDKAIQMYLEVGTEESLTKIYKIVEHNNYSNEKKAEIYYSVGNKYFSQKDYNKALIEYKASIKLNPKFLDPYIKVSSTYLALGQSDKAELYKGQASTLLDKPLPDLLDTEIHEQELIMDLLGDI